jgi:hypothetical protein
MIFAYLTQIEDGIECVILSTILQEKTEIGDKRPLKSLSFQRACQNPFDEVLAQGQKENQRDD